LSSLLVPGDDSIEYVARVGPRGLPTRLARLLAVTLVVLSAGCTTTRQPQVPDNPMPSPSETKSLVAAQVVLGLPANDELFGPVAGEGALWLRDVQTGKVFRIDPKKNQLAAIISLEPGCCLAAGEGALWATGTEKNHLLRINPSSNKVTRTIGVGAFPEGLAVAFGSVWISNRHAGTVSRVDPKTNKLVARIDVTYPGPAGPNSVGRGGDFMWVGVSKSREIVRIDPRTNKVAGTLTIPGAGCHDLATYEATLWLARGCVDDVRPNKIWKIDTRRMKVAATIEPGGDLGAPAFWRGQLWILTSRNLISIDGKTNRVVNRATIRGPGNAAVADGTLWVSSSSSLLRLRLN
jgi:virginiamycin B lyase